MQFISYDNIIRQPCNDNYCNNLYITLYIPTVLYGFKSNFSKPLNYIFYMYLQYKHYRFFCYQEKYRSTK